MYADTRGGVPSSVGISAASNSSGWGGGSKGATPDDVYSSRRPAGGAAMPPVSGLSSRQDDWGLSRGGGGGGGPSNMGGSMGTAGLPPSAQQPGGGPPGIIGGAAGSGLALALGMGRRYEEEDKIWYYLDPQGSTQGPCSIKQFKEWLFFLGKDPGYEREHDQFRQVEIWQAGMPNRIPLLNLVPAAGARP